MADLNLEDLAAELEVVTDKVTHQNRHPGNVKVYIKTTGQLLPNCRYEVTFNEVENHEGHVIELHIVPGDPIF